MIYTQNYQIPPDANEKNYISFLEVFIIILSFVFLILAALSFSLTLLLIIKNEWIAANYFSDNLTDFFLSTFPFAVFGSFLLLAAISFLLFCRTEVSKYFNFFQKLALFFFFCMFISFGFYYSGSADLLHSQFLQIPKYNELTEKSKKVWLYPEFGLLAGEIGTIKDLENFLLIDFEAKTWSIDGSRADILDLNIIQPGNRIKIIGKKSGDDTFEAKKILNY